MSRLLDGSRARTGFTQADGTTWHALVALAAGALLGYLAGMQYDVLFGLSEPLCFTLRSLVVTVTWTCVGLAKPGPIYIGSTTCVTGEQGENTAHLEVTGTQLSFGGQPV